MILYAVIVVARQELGEYVLVQTQKAFKTEAEAEAMVKTLRKQYLKEDGSYVPVNINTPHGDIACNCEVGIFQIELDN